MAWIQHRYGINLLRYGIGTAGMRLEQKKKKSWEKMRIRMYIREETLSTPPCTCYLSKKILLLGRKVRFKSETWDLGFKTVRDLQNFKSL